MLTSQFYSRSNRIARRLFSSKFYDSQSGLFVNMPQGVRIHDETFCNQLSYDNLNKDLPVAVLKMRPTSLSINRTSMLDGISYPKILHEQTKALFVTPVLNYDEVTQVCHEKMFFEGIIFAVHSKNFKCKETRLLDGIRLAVDNGLTVRCHLLCDLSSSSITDPLEIVNSIATLADAGSSCIMLVPSNVPVDEDVARDVVENSFNLDVEADPISERLGIAGNISTVKLALKLRCTHTLSHSLAVDHRPRLKYPSIPEIRHLISSK